MRVGEGGWNGVRTSGHDLPDLSSDALKLDIVFIVESPVALPNPRIG